jgi:hypothetical protein
MNLHYLRRLISIAILLILMIREKFNDSFTYYVKPIWLAENDISPNVPRLCDERNSLTQCFRINECNKLEWWFKVAEYPLIAKPLLAVSKVTPVIGFRKFSWNKSLCTFLFSSQKKRLRFLKFSFFSFTPTLSNN